MKYTLGMIYIVIMIQTSYAMEYHNKPNIIKEIASVKDPSYVRYLTNDSVVIGGEGCSIVNLLTDEEKKISEFNCSYLAVDSQKKKIAISCDKTIEIYNTETYKREWFKTEDHTICSFEIDSCRDTLFLRLMEDGDNYRRIIARCNYVENSCGTDNKDVYHCSSIAFHPKEQSLCVIEGETNICIYQMSDLAQKLKKFKFNDSIYDCKCSADGYIAIDCTDSNIIYLLNSNIENYGVVESLAGSVGLLSSYYKHRTYLCLQGKEGEGFGGMAFYGRGSVLATSVELGLEHFMHFWDFVTQKIIYTMPLMENSYDEDFSFSPNGEQMAVVDKKKCFIFQLPFEVRYEDKTKERFPLYWLLLKYYVSQQDKEMPQDIVTLLGSVLLKTFKR